MGCICPKGTTTDDYVAENHVRKARKSRRERRGLMEADGGGNEATTSLILSEERERNEETAGKSGNSLVQNNMGSSVGYRSGEQVLQPRITRIGSINRGERGAQVLAGWPSWLTTVAGEAISGWIPRRADSFEKLEKIGQGTYSSVYRARDLETNKIVALKKVRFANMDPESVRFMAREIIILRRLNHPNVMKLEGMITSRVSGSLYLIFEYMEHDLTGLAALPGVKFSEAQIKCYMQQLLRGLEHCHSHGVLHRDIKGSNLLVDYNGNLKIGDFGLATVFEPSQGQPMTSRVVTLWYRSPELLLGATDYGVAIDLWSTGCILAELFAGKPIMPGRTEVEQLHKIFKLCGSPSENYWKKLKLRHSTIFKPQHPYRRVVAETFKDFPKSALNLLEVLLAVEPENRGTASSALQNEFFTTKPLPSDPYTLPKYPPSKEYNVKYREEEPRRGRAAVNKGHDKESVKSSKASKATLAPDAKAVLPSSIEKKHLQANPKRAERRSHEKNALLIDPARSAMRASKFFTYSCQSAHQSAYGPMRPVNLNAEEEVFGSTRNSSAGLRKPMSCWTSANAAAHLSRFSNSVAAGGGSRLDMSGGGDYSWRDDRFGARLSHGGGGESIPLLDGCKSSNKDFHPFLKKHVVGYATKDGRIHYSGPLVPAGGNLEEMLKQHEKQLRQAVRKACLDKQNLNEKVANQNHYFTSELQ